MDITNAYLLKDARSVGSGSLYSIVRGQPVDAYQYEISPNTWSTKAEKAVVFDSA